MLGFASDFVQGLNTGDYNVAGRSLALSPAAGAIPVDVLFAGVFGIEAHRTGDKKYRDAAINSLASVGGSLGVAVARQATGAKKFRKPKINLLRDVLGSE
jgi:hypothetical protein